MEILTTGVAALLTWQNLAAVALGCFIGLWTGALPGLGGVSTMAMMLPLTYGMDPLTALLLLTSISTASEYGGSITSILINVPGEATAAAAAFDGYPMARQGLAGVALGYSAAASLIGAVLGALVLITLAQPVLSFVISFGPPEYFALAVLGLVIISAVSSQSVLKGLLMSLLGIAVGFIGVDSVIGIPRFTFGILELQAGVGFIPVITGLFAISELIFMVERGGTVSETGRLTGSLWQGVFRTFRHWGALAKSTLIGCALGAMPGIGATATNFLAYTVVQRTSRDPDSFGKGNPEGVIAPELANNACVQTALIPALTLGIPAGASSAMLIVVMTIHGVRPGQMLFTSGDSLLNGLFAGLFLSAILSFLMMTVLIRVFIRLTIMRTEILAPLLLILSIVAAYASEGSMLDLFVCVVFGFLGYILRRNGFPVVNLVMGFVLGKLIEVSFVQSLMMTGGSLRLFYTRPTTIALLAIGALILVWACSSAWRTRRRLADGS